jgi:ComF family protein
MVFYNSFFTFGKAAHGAAPYKGMNLPKRFILLLRGFFFPSVCALCGGALIDPDEIKYGLCEPCRAAIVPDPSRRCNSCGRPLISEQGICLSCRNGEQHSYERLWVLFPYNGKYRKLLAAYKFAGNLALGNFLAQRISETIAAFPVLENAHLVPVPPRPGKIKETGWDQVEYLAKLLRKNGFSVCRCLKRKKSKVQKRLSRIERMKNLKGRVYHYGTIPKTVLVIDDVITTGSTLEVCSGILKEAGAEKVYGLCLFYG